VQRKKQAEKCVGYALSCCSVQLPAPLPSDKVSLPKLLWYHDEKW